jgi:hypothetical protein
MLIRGGERGSPLIDPYLAAPDFALIPDVCKSCASDIRQFEKTRPYLGYPHADDCQAELGRRK